MQNKLANLWVRLNKDNMVWWAAGLVAGWRLLLEVVNQVVQVAFNHQVVGLANLTRWANWDGGWYWNINNVGYHHTPGPLQQENVAFFPGFPETVGVIARTLHTDFIAVGLVLNILLTVVLVFFIMKLGQLLAVRFGAADKQRKVGLISAITLLAFPASFFLVAYYAEAMLVLGFVGAVYFALRRQLWPAVPFMVMATASKVMGAIVVVTVGVIVLEQWLRDHGKPIELIKQWAITALGLSGLVAYMAYLWARFGDPILFYHIQQAWGRNGESFFVVRLLKDFYLRLLDIHGFGGAYGYAINLCWMLTPFVLLAVVLIAWRVYKVYWPMVLAGITMALPLSTGIPDSLYRYALVAAPIIPFAVLWFIKHKIIIFYGLIGLSGIAMLCFAAGFLSGNHFSG